GIKAGDRVLAFTSGGGYAEYVSVNFQQVNPLPDQISYAESTALLVQGMTALGLLNDAVSGQTILVHAAAGGVGSILVQLAKLKGLRVIGTASSTEKLEKVLSFGADAAVNYSENDWPDEVLKANNGKGVDIVIEMVGGEIVARNLEVLGVNGTMLVYGAASGENYPLPILSLLQKNTTVRGYWLSLEPAERRAAFAAELADHVASGRVKIAITEYPLEKAADAHRALEGRRTTGKIVLKVN
ncbi:MAG: zinc-binding dehydrogenase, partial [Acidobacteriota bacterium]